MALIDSPYHVITINGMNILIDPHTQMIWELEGEDDDDIVQKIQVLTKYGFFSPASKESKNLLANEESELNYIVINPSNKCNLSCWYCYVDRKNDIRDEQPSSEEILFQMLRILDDKKERKSTSSIAFSLFYTGEITLNFQIFLDIERNLVQVRENYDFSILLLLPSTNLLNPSKDFVNYINNYGYLTVSMDLTNDGQKAQVRGNIKLFDNEIVKHAMIPIHSKIDNIFGYYSENLDFFDKVSLRPVRIPENSEYPWNDQNLEGFSLELEKFVEKILFLEEEQIANFLSSMGPSDYFSKYLDSIITREKKIVRCPAGTTAIALDENFNEYPCSGLIGIDEFQQKFSIKERKNAFNLNSNVTNTGRCSQCAIRYFCGGYCMDWEFKEKRKMNSIDISSECKVNYIYFVNCVYFVMQLQKKYPAILRNYIEKKSRKFRLDYYLNFNDFVKIFV